MVERSRRFGSDWAAARAAFEAGEGSLREIGDRFGMSESGIRGRARRDGWDRTLRPPRAAAGGASGPGGDMVPEAPEAGALDPGLRRDARSLKAVPAIEREPAGEHPPADDRPPAGGRPSGAVEQNEIGVRGPKPAPPRRPHGRALRRTPSDRAAMIARLYRVFEARIVAIEARFDPDAAEDAERDTRVLAALARTLDILLALDRKAQADGGEATHGDRPDIDTLRQDLADRLDRLARGARSG